MKHLLIALTIASLVFGSTAVLAYNVAELIAQGVF